MAVCGAELKGFKQSPGVNKQIRSERSEVFHSPWCLNLYIHRQKHTISLGVRDSWGGGVGKALGSPGFHSFLHLS